MPSPTNRDSLPFEPKSNPKKVKEKKAIPSPENKKSPPVATKTKAKKKEDSSLKEIPQVVSTRMVKRMALFSGIPTGLGILSFFVFYAVVSQEWFKIPNTAVLLVSMGLFGLGVLGLSYGILSTSWDEERVGTWWGWSEFVVNFGRLTSAWKNSRKKPLNEE